MSYMLGDIRSMYEMITQNEADRIKYILSETDLKENIDLLNLRYNHNSLKTSRNIRLQK